MGTICPKCGVHRAYKRWLTVDQKPANKASDVIGAELDCGHKFGSKEFMDFQEEISKVLTAKQKKIQEIEDDAKNDIAAAWSKIEASRRKPLKKEV